MENFNPPQKTLDHPRHLKSGVPPLVIYIVYTTESVRRFYEGKNLTCE